MSAVLITRNAEAQLDACLESLSFADEVIVVDGGSDDATCDIARKRGARVIPSEWRGFGPQKQFAVSRAANDWVLCVDADERVSPELAQSIIEALESPSSSIYRIARRNRFMGRWLRHGEGYPDWSPRLFDRRMAGWSDDPVHEKVLSVATPGTLRGDLLHESAEDLSDYWAKQNRYTSLAAERLHASGHRASLPRLVLSPVVRFLKMYVFRLGFLDGVAGLVHITIGCANSFFKYAKLFELQRTRRGH